MRAMTGAAIAGGLGAVLMYLLDPVQGTRRRAMARDRAGHVGRKTWRFASAAKTDLSNRLGGLGARVRRARRHESPNGDARLEHVRAVLGRVVTHPGAVHVMVAGDVVRLDGAVLASELMPLLAAIRSVNGVSHIDNRLIVREHGSGVPGLQGTGTAPRHRLRHTLRAPGIQAMAMVAGVVGAAALVRRRRRAMPAAKIETNLELPFGGA